MLARNTSGSSNRCSNRVCAEVVFPLEPSIADQRRVGVVFPDQIGIVPMLEGQLGTQAKVRFAVRRIILDRVSKPISDDERFLRCDLTVHQHL